MIDILKFTTQKTGMDDEYKKVLDLMIKLTNMNGKTKKYLDEKYKALYNEKMNYFEKIERDMVQFTLEERALEEITENWDNEKFWN